MNQQLVDTIVNAVLYEGYILYPYRASAKKNRQRFTFGRVYPEAYSIAQAGAEPCIMQTECLVQGLSATLEIAVRFLHPMARDVGLPVSAPNEKDFQSLAELRVGDEIYQSWHEAVERNVRAENIPLRSLPSEFRNVPFRFPGHRTFEEIVDGANRPAGIILRRQESVEGRVEIVAAPVDSEVVKITVKICNLSPLPADCLADQEAVLLRTLASAHTILRVENGHFLSLIDPPADYLAAAATCKNIGTWPVLVGEENKGDRDAMISSPIILYDYPMVAPESPGDLFDAAEIDEILSLRILTMTDEEKREMRHVDAHARRILERTESLPAEDFMKLHGTLRDPCQPHEDFFAPAARLESVSVQGVQLHAGSRVRIRPRGRADVMDIALAGRLAIIEALECDAEDRIQLALVLEDDPGKDLGMMRQPGHRFFYGVDEVEPVIEES
jgi:hydrogenase maturation protease